MGRPEGKRQVGRPRPRRKNIKIDLQEMKLGDADWVDLAQGMAGYRLLWMGLWTFAFHKMRGLSWLPENVLDYQEGLLSVESVTYLLTYLLSNTKIGFNLQENSQRLKYPSSVGYNALSQRRYFPGDWNFRPRRCQESELSHYASPSQTRVGETFREAITLHS